MNIKTISTKLMAKLKVNLRKKMKIQMHILKNYRHYLIRYKREMIKLLNYRSNQQNIRKTLSQKIWKQNTCRKSLKKKLVIARINNQSNKMMKEDRARQILKNNKN